MAQLRLLQSHWVQLPGTGESVCVCVCVCVCPTWVVGGVCVCVCVCVCVSYLGGRQWPGFLQVEVCLLDGSGTYLEARGCGGSQHPGRKFSR